MHSSLSSYRKKEATTTKTAWFLHTLNLHTLGQLSPEGHFDCSKYCAIFWGVQFFFWRLRNLGQRFCAILLLYHCLYSSSWIHLAALFYTWSSWYWNFLFPTGPQTEMSICIVLKFGSLITNYLPSFFLKNVCND